MANRRSRIDLNVTQQHEVVKELDKNISQSKVAQKFGISQSQVSRIKAKRQEIVPKGFAHPRYDVANVKYH